MKEVKHNGSKNPNLKETEDNIKQESPPAWTQEAYCTCRVASTRCAALSAGGRVPTLAKEDTYAGQGVPTLDMGGTYLGQEVTTLER